jgi:hypothetical protein
MNITHHLQNAIEEFTLTHMQLPTKLRVTYDFRADLERHNALPDDMEIVDVDSPVSVLRVE